LYKLRVYSKKDSINYKRGIKTVIFATGTKKKMIELAVKCFYDLKCQVVREPDQKIVFDNGLEPNG
jgi:hypothetical protein